MFELVINGRLHWYPFGMRCEHFHFERLIFFLWKSENRTDNGPTTELLLFHYFHGRASWHGSTRTIEMVRQ